MPRAVIVGGSGHVGTYLVPRLVEAGYDVINVSRGIREAYRPSAAWKAVQSVTLDRGAEEKAGTFGGKIRGLQPDIVIDMVCFRPESARQMVAALAGEVEHFLHCGTIWVHGPSVTVPTSETQPRRPVGQYGTWKAEIEAYLLTEAHLRGFPVSIVHPGHIVGPGWDPLNPAGNFNPEVFGILARGEELALPNFGMETVHHVHADDVAQVFMGAIGNRVAAMGESFHAVSPAAVSLRGYAEAMAAWFGREPQLVFLPWPEWKARQSETDANATWEHIYRSPSSSIAKAERLLGYRPRYTSFEAVRESVTWLVEQGRIRLA